MDLMSLRVTQNAYFSLQIPSSFVIFCVPTAGIEKYDGTGRDGRTDVKFEIVM